MFGRMFAAVGRRRGKGSSEGGTPGGNGTPENIPITPTVGHYFVAGSEGVHQDLGTGTRVKETFNLTSASQVVLQDVAAVQLAYFSGAALLKDCSVVAWGGNKNSQCGNGYFTGNPFPRPQKTGLVKARALVGCNAHYHALMQNSTVYSWAQRLEGVAGDNVEWRTFIDHKGEKGSGNNGYENRIRLEQAPYKPTQVLFEDEAKHVEPLQGVRSIAAGSRHVMAILNNGSLVGWGKDGHKNLMTAAPTPVYDEGKFWPVAKLSSFVRTGEEAPVAVACGDKHTLVLLKNHEVWGFGNNESGQLGANIETGASQVKAPVKMEMPSGYENQVLAIAAGAKHSHVLMKDGTIWSCGQSQNYEAISKGGELVAESAGWLAVETGTKEFYPDLQKANLPAGADYGVYIATGSGGGTGENYGGAVFAICEDKTNRNSKTQLVGWGTMSIPLNHVNTAMIPYAENPPTMLVEWDTENKKTGEIEHHEKIVFAPVKKPVIVPVVGEPVAVCTSEFSMAALCKGTAPAPALEVTMTSDEKNVTLKWNAKAPTGTVDWNVNISEESQADPGSEGDADSGTDSEGEGGGKVIDNKYIDVTGGEQLPKSIKEWTSNKGIFSKPLVPKTPYAIKLKYTGAEPDFEVMVYSADLPCGQPPFLTYSLPKILMPPILNGSGLVTEEKYLTKGAVEKGTKTEKIRCRYKTSAKPGEILKSDIGEWGREPTSYSYQWIWEDTPGTVVPIEGATDKHYTVQSPDIGHHIGLIVKATNAFGTGEFRAVMFEFKAGTYESNTFPTTKVIEP